MKVFKELPKSIYYSSVLRLKSVNGLTKNKKQIPVLVSLTSIKTRLNTLDIAIKALLYQDVLPEKIILWLHKDLKNTVPKRLQKLEGSFFEIRYSELDCPHLKFVESIKEFPEKIIVTSDDDLIYMDNHLNNLYQEHLRNPSTIIGNRTVQIKLDDKDNYQTYVSWRSKEEKKLYNSLMPLGAWGVLYPPNIMKKEVADDKVFLKLAPKADDLWFKCMSLVNNVLTVEVSKRPKEPIPIIGSQKVSLKKENVRGDKNDVQWLQLSDHFSLKEILKTNH